MEIDQRPSLPHFSLLSPSGTVSSSHTSVITAPSRVLTSSGRGNTSGGNAGLPQSAAKLMSEKGFFWGVNLCDQMGLVYVHESNIAFALSKEYCVKTSL